MPIEFWDMVQTTAAIVSLSKINKTLPGFKCDWNAQNGAQQLFDLFTRIDMSKDTFLFRGSLG